MLVLDLSVCVLNLKFKAVFSIEFSGIYLKFNTEIKIKTLTYYDILLRNYCEEFGKVTPKRGPRLTPYWKYFTKITKVLVLSYNLSHFLSIFKKVDEKLAQMYRVFYFYIIRNYTRNLSKF